MRKYAKATVLVCAIAGAPAGVYAMGGEPPPFKPVNADYASAEQAIKSKNWTEAVDLLKRAAVAEPNNADVYNYLGYAERHRGNMDAAFKHYAKALALDPKHRGAHEYVGEAYLLVGNLAKAEEHLAQLDKICFFSCEEYRELKEKIAEYKQKKAKAG